ncbi:uncharacterized protein LOC127094524 [Lathyrus oleraceus]|uniref:uncharacterized protein LOC127094524 n=1 Tax=Pisum sativum TaxID=3888 RepID=UPI0021D3721A|nr:uncharacterized protein LOC127094524 [Pisum sativum]
MDTGRDGHISYKFPEVNMDSLLKMAERFPPGNLEIFKSYYGNIIDYLKTPLSKYQHSALHTLLQFYDPPLRCFTFPDYQLAPTLEEYSCILGIPIKLQVPFHVSMEVPDSEHVVVALYLGKFMVDANLKTKGGLLGFQLSFILTTLDPLAKKENWKVFSTVLACNIYGIVLFPNMVGFVNMNAIRIFMMGNLVPTFLGDIYHSIHSKNHKKRGGLVWCCAPLLYHWFRSHLPCKGAFADNKETSKWSKRLMELTSKDLVWYNLRLDRMGRSKVIVSCGEFPNVPLMGVSGGINYNHVLSQIQLGYALKGPPEDKSIQESLFYNVTDDVEMMKKDAKAWSHISCKGREFFGKKGCVAYPLYLDWIKERVQTVLLPFLIEKPLYPQSPDHPDFVPREYFNQTLLLNKKLKQEKEELSMQVFIFRQEKMDSAHKLRERDEFLGEYGLAVDGRVRKKTKVDRIRGDTSTVIEEQKRALEEVEEEIKQKHREHESLKISKARMERKYKDKIKRLEKQI